MRELPAPTADVVTRPAAVFILGVTQRCGTHFLYDLITEHPHCRPALSRTSWEGSWEDNLLRYGDRLEDFAHAIGSSNRLNPDDSEQRLLRALGRGLLEHLRSLDPTAADDDRTVVTKTPMMKNLRLLPELLPSVPAVLLVRDPHAVVASAMRTFGRSADEWILAWRAGAREALAFERAHPDVATLVRYEDLYSAPVPTLTALFRQLSLDPSVYDFDLAQRLPVRGSSQLGGAARSISWEPRPRSEEFRPLARGAELSPSAATRLRWLAEPEMRELGYWQADDRRLLGWRRGLHHAADVTRRGRTAVRLAQAQAQRLRTP
jgi:hypothetical protein